MIEVFLLPTCPYQTYPLIVCGKWIERADNGASIYRIRVSNNLKLYVNRCTYLANSLGMPYVFEQSNKWCNKEKMLKSVWTY